MFKINMGKRERPLRSIACKRKTAASVLLKLFINGELVTPPSHEQNSIFKCKQYTCTTPDSRGREKYNYTVICTVVRGLPAFRKRFKADTNGYFS